MYLSNTAVAADVANELAQEQKQAWQVISGRRLMPKRAVPKSWMLGVGFLVLAVLALYVHTVAQEAGLNKLQREIHKLREENVAKRSQLASIQNPRKIDDLARNDLGMQEPKEVVFLNQPVSSMQAPKANLIPPPPAVIHEGF
jgi:cell division protein FtsB